MLSESTQSKSFVLNMTERAGPDAVTAALLQLSIKRDPITRRTH